MNPDDRAHARQSLLLVGTSPRSVVGVCVVLRTSAIGVVQGVVSRCVGCGRSVLLLRPTVPTGSSLTLRSHRCSQIALLPSLSLPTPAMSHDQKLLDAQTSIEMPAGQGEGHAQNAAEAVGRAVQSRERGSRRRPPSSECGGVDKDRKCAAQWKLRERAS